jgi:signal transduction histidine kinase
MLRAPMIWSPSRLVRFVWQMDAETRLTIGSDEFIALAGAPTAAVLGLPWLDIATALGLDRDGQVARAIATHDTWSGLAVAWPIGDGATRLTVELSGLPVFDRERVFRGYRGFGVCRDLAPAAAASAPPDDSAENVVMFHAAEATAPALNAIERRAFRELARRLTERLTQPDAELESTAPDLAAPEPQADPPPAIAVEPPSDAPISAEQETLRAELLAARTEIAERKEAETELIDARRQAEKASAAKSDFLAKISHEIRNPLNAIIGFSEVMMQERFGPVGNERYRQYLKDIHASGQLLISLINDLLDLSKIEAGKLELEFAAVALNELTQESVALMQPQANRERIIIRTALSPKLPPVIADARSLRQIVLNLTSNAIKFTGAGGQVIVSTALTDLGEVMLRVRDTGVGMSEQEIAVALEPFRQLATSTRFGSGGTGLGLPLSKALAEANRAGFRIVSTPNAGTLVEITFPAARVVGK